MSLANLSGVLDAENQKAEEYVDACVEAAGIKDQKNAPFSGQPSARPRSWARRG